MRDRKIGNNFNRFSWLKYPCKFEKLLKLDINDLKDKKEWSDSGISKTEFMKKMQLLVMTKSMI